MVPEFSKLTKKHRNASFRRLRTACITNGVDFSEFHPDFEDSKFRFKFNYGNDEGFFAVGTNINGQRIVTMKPGLDEQVAHFPYITIEQAMTYIHFWVQAIKEEFYASDLWEEYAESKSSNVLDTVNNDPLTQEEQTKATKILENVKTYVLENSNQEDTESLKAHIDSHFDHLHQSLDKVGKKDWILMFMGTIFGLIGSHIFSAENVSDFIQFAMEQIQILSDLDVPTLVNEISPPEIQGDTVGKPH